MMARISFFFSPDHLERIYIPLLASVGKSGGGPVSGRVERGLGLVIRLPSNYTPLGTLDRKALPLL
jgi:hypothetical protein